MNYIKRLENEVKEVRAELVGLKSGIDALHKYLSASKFFEDTTVQVTDVMNRIAEARSVSSNLLHEQIEVNARNGEKR